MVNPRELILQGFAEWYPETLLELRQHRGAAGLLQTPECAAPADLLQQRDFLMNVALREKFAAALYFRLSDLCCVPELKSLWGTFGQEDSFHFLRAGVSLFRLGADISLTPPELRFSTCQCRSLRGLVFTLNEAVRCKLALVQAYEPLKTAGELAHFLAQERLHLQFLTEVLFVSRPGNFGPRQGEGFLGADPKWIET